MVKTETSIKRNAAFFILLCTAAIPIIMGTCAATIGSSYESSCSGIQGEKPTCTTRYVYKGIGDTNLDLSLPSLQTLAAATGTLVGTTLAVYTAWKNGKIPEQLKGMLGGEDVSSPN